MKTEQESTTTSTDGQGVEESAVESAAPSRHVINVAVGSTNPVKVNAVRQALQQVLTTGTSQEKEVVIDVQGFSVPSGVPDQPFGDVSTWYRDGSIQKLLPFVLALINASDLFFHLISTSGGNTTGSKE